MMGSRADGAGEQAKQPGGMLPGIAGICMWMLVVATVGAFGALRGVYAGHARFVVLPVCTMIVVGVFGLLRLRRWGWAMVLAGTLLLSFGYGYMARTMGAPGFWVMALLNLCFFLYLSRPEVRSGCGSEDGPVAAVEWMR